MPKPLPKHYLPMLASFAPRPFNDPDWQWEVKWDGYRMLTYVQKGNVELRSCNDKDYTKRFAIVACAGKEIEEVTFDCYAKHIKKNDK